LKNRLILRTLIVGANECLLYDKLLSCNLVFSQRDDECCGRICLLKTNLTN